MSDGCQREACACCGANSWTEAFFIAGQLYCRACHIEILHSKGKNPPRQQGLWPAAHANRGGENAELLCGPPAIFPRNEN